MTTILNELLLFSCLAALVTGIVLTAAHYPHLILRAGRWDRGARQLMLSGPLHSAARGYYGLTPDGHAAAQHRQRADHAGLGNLPLWN